MCLTLSICIFILLPPSALLYMNSDFEGGEFIFTEMDAKTVTVRNTDFPVGLVALFKEDMERLDIYKIWRDRGIEAH